MKILLVGTCLGVGGAEKVIVDLADSFEKRGHTVGIVSLSGAAVLLPRSQTVRVVSLHASGFLDFPSLSHKLISLIKDFQPDVVHAHLFHAIIVCRIARIFAHVPFLVTTVHSSRVGGRIRAAAYRITNFLSDVSSSVSAEAADNFVRSGAFRAGGLQVIHNGVSLSEYWRNGSARASVLSEFGIRGEGPVAVAVGRLNEAKDYPNLLRAVSLLRTAGTEVAVLVAGEGTLLPDLESLTSQLGLHESVRFIGLRSDVQRLLSACDLFVMSSAWEGLPMAVGQAMACECVVVATDCGGVSELLGDTGFLAKPQDPAALAAAMLRAVLLPADARKSLGRAARARIGEHFSLEASAERWLNIYQSHPRPRTAT